MPPMTTIVASNGPSARRKPTRESLCDFTRPTWNGRRSGRRRHSTWPAATSWAVRVDDLAGARDALRLSGTTTTAMRRSSTAIAAALRRHAAEQVTTANGAAGANFQVYAALLEPGRRRADGAAGVRSAARRGAAARREHRPLRAAIRGRLRARPGRGRPRDDAAHAPHHHHARRTTRPARWPIVPRSKQSGGIARTAGAHVLVDEVYLDAADAALQPAAPPGRRSASSYQPAA